MILNEVSSEICQLFLIMRCRPTIRELIVATLLPLSSQPATGLSALAPAQRAGAKRLCAMARLGPRGTSAPMSGFRAIAGLHGIAKIALHYRVSLSGTRHSTSAVAALFASSPRRL